MAGLLLVFYWYQPLRIDFAQKRPDKPLPRMPIQDTGLLSGDAKVLVITAHPDDEAYYIGGTLYALKKAKARMKLVTLTNGDKGYYLFSDTSGTAKIRQQELEESVKQVGAQVEFFNFKDGRLPVNDKTIDRVSTEIEAYRPTHILCFDADYPPRISHGDHRAAGEIAEEAAKRANYKGWMLHFATFGPNTAVDVSEFWPQAEELLGIHKSQFFGEKLERIRATVSDKAMTSGAEFGVTYAEPFRAVKRT